MKNNNDLNQLRHSTAHLLAHAVSELYPNTLLTIGPATETGFFYDFLPEHNFKEEDLAILSKRMLEITDRDLPLTHEQMPKDEARILFKNNPFKLELIDGIPGDTVGIARQGDFYDLCKGDHVASTGLLKNFVLLGLSGSYWRADRNGQVLQRISGTAFPTADELALFEKRREDALKYDHRKLGKELDLFSFHEEGVGFPFYHPHGKRVINIMMQYMRNLIDQHGYQEISTPIMLNDDLWRRSGHYDHYKDNMYFCTIEDKQYAIKPMNCPGAILIYKERPRSYRQLPLRLAEFGLVHRYELSGVLHGLMRVRGFTQDDTHIFCTQEQIAEEVKTIIKMTYNVFRKFGFEDVHVELSTKPINAMGSDELWDIATNSLRDNLENLGISYTVNEGDGAFYGPKIDLHIKDSMDRSWQCGTVQLDFFQPINFDLSYVSSHGDKQRPVMIHRTIYGSLERFFGILLEHHKGKLPFWLAPIQMRILTITDEQKPYAHHIAHHLVASGFRVEVDESSDPLSGQIKTAQLQRIPWMLVIGKKEVEQKTITLRYFDGKQEFNLTLETLLEKAHAAN